MKNLIFFTALFAITLTGTSYAEEEKEIQYHDLPTIIQKTVLNYVHVENIKKVEKIKDENVIKYEIESKTNDITMDITIAQNGIVVEIEKSISLTELPKEAQAEITKDYPSIEIQEIESVELFYYDIKGVIDGKTIKFKVLATGDIENLEETKEEEKLDT